MVGVDWASSTRQGPVTVTVVSSVKVNSQSPSEVHETLSDSAPVLSRLPGLTLVAAVSFLALASGIPLVAFRAGCAWCSVLSGASAPAGISGFPWCARLACRSGDAGILSVFLPGDSGGSGGSSPAPARPSCRQGRGQWNHCPVRLSHREGLQGQRDRPQRPSRPSSPAALSCRCCAR